MTTEQPKCTAADGRTTIHTLPGVGLVVSAVDFNRLHAENEALKQALARPYGYAGATVWIGDKTVTQVVTETQVKYEREPGQMITDAAQECLDLLAKQVAAPQPQRDDTALLRQALEQLEINRTNFRKGPSKSICKMLAGGNDEIIAALRERLK
jgi:hypothetical protein